MLELEMCRLQVFSIATEKPKRFSTHAKKRKLMKKCAVYLHL